MDSAGSLLWPHSCARRRKLFVCSWIQTTPSVCKVNFIIIFLPMKFSQTFRESFLYGDNERIACYALNLERILHISAFRVIHPHQWEGVIVKEMVRPSRCLATFCGLNAFADLAERCTTCNGQCFSVFSYYIMFVLRGSCIFPSLYRCVWSVDRT